MLLRTSMNKKYTFIALIPKKKSAKELRDFRPIILIGSFYRLITKVLSGRLQIVSKWLSSKIEKSWILCQWQMKLWILDLCQQKPGILCKLDNEKVYDHVNWAFFMKLMGRMGFGHKWIRWIKHCITTVNFSVLLYGSLCWVLQLTKRSQAGRSADPLFVPIGYGRSQ